LKKKERKDEQQQRKRKNTRIDKIVCNALGNGQIASLQQDKQNMTFDQTTTFSYAK
jgi:hypothetical protein